jgi:hypothetical protein
MHLGITLYGEEPGQVVEGIGDMISEFRNVHRLLAMHMQPLHNP